MFRRLKNVQKKFKKQSDHRRTDGPTDGPIERDFKPCLLSGDQRDHPDLIFMLHTVRFSFRCLFEGFFSHSFGRCFSLQMDPCNFLFLSAPPPKQRKLNTMAESRQTTLDAFACLASQGHRILPIDHPQVSS